MHNIPWDFVIKTDHSIPASRPDVLLINKKKRTCHLVGFPVLAGNKVKMKENKKINKYQELTRELGKMWNMEVTVKPIVIGALEIVPKSLEKELEI